MGSASVAIELNIDQSFDAEETRIIEQALFELQNWFTNRVYEISQELVPVDTGFLKSTGEVTFEGGVPTLAYHADYADVVENGIPGVRDGVYFIQGAVDAALEELPGALEEYLPVGTVLTDFGIDAE